MMLTGRLKNKNTFTKQLTYQEVKTQRNPPLETPQDKSAKRDGGES